MFISVESIEVEKEIVGSGSVSAEPPPPPPPPPHDIKIVEERIKANVVSVSYTHLTLPTTECV